MTIVDLPIADHQRTYEEMRTETEKRIDAEIKARVQEGIAFLKETYGTDWADHIDLEVFDIGDVNACVLGQLYGEQAEQYDSNGYDWAVEHILSEDEGTSLQYGFSARTGDWGTLQVEWEEQIARRRHTV